MLYTRMESEFSSPLVYNITAIAIILMADYYYDLQNHIMLIVWFLIEKSWTSSQLAVIKIINKSHEYSHGLYRRCIIVNVFFLVLVLSVLSFKLLDDKYTFLRCYCSGCMVSSGFFFCYLEGRKENRKYFLWNFFCGARYPLLYTPSSPSISTVFWVSQIIRTHNLIYCGKNSNLPFYAFVVNIFLLSLLKAICYCNGVDIQFIS